MLSDREVANVCMNRLRNIDSFTQQLQSDRENALDRYRGEPYGDEVEGQSQFVTTDVRDTIEAVMPQIIEMFVGDENPVEFSARDAEDVEQARMESEYVRHVYNQQNDGFMTTYSWVKDGLMFKNGVVKSYWDERVDEEQETYEGKSYLEYLQIASEMEIEEVTATIGEEEYSLDELEQLSPEMVMFAKFDFTVKIEEDNSQVRIYPVPPENFFVEREHASLNLDDCAMICERITVTESDLIVDGYSQDLVSTIPSGNEEQYNEEHINRHAEEGSVVDNIFEDHGSREIVIHEFYIRMDGDGDGKSELRFVKLAGPSGSTVLENEVVDSQPYSVWSPVPETHKHYALSYVDLVETLQELRTAVMRGMLDNLYMTNYPTKTVIPDQTYLEDLHQTGAGVNWRVKTQDAVRVHVTPFMGEASVGVLGMINEMRHERTGVNPVSQGLDPSALADSTNIVGPMIINQALARVKMVARIYAETGFKHLMGRIHELCSKHDKQDRSYDVAGEYSTVSPREWKKRKEYKVRVGVGHADRIQRLQAIRTIKENQAQIVQAGGLGGPLLGFENVHTTLVEEAKLLGYADGAKFYGDPKEYQPPPKKDEPLSELIQIEEAKGVADLQKQAVDNQTEIMKHQDDMALKEKELAQKYELALKELQQEKDLKHEEFLFKYGKDVIRKEGTGNSSARPTGE